MAAEGTLSCSFCSAQELQELQFAANPLAAVIAKAEAELQRVVREAETEKARADAAVISLEQTGSELESRFQALAEENQRLNAEKVVQANEIKEQLQSIKTAKEKSAAVELQIVERDASLQKLETEARVLHNDKRSLLELVEQKLAEIQEKDVMIRGYLDKIVSLTEEKSALESRARQTQAEQRRAQGSLAQLEQEKELMDKHNKWLTEELSTKTDALLNERAASSEELLAVKTQLASVEQRAAKLAETESGLRKSLQAKEDEVTQSAEKLLDIQKASRSQIEQLEEQLTTTKKLADLYKEELEERSSKCVEYQGVLKEMKEQFEQSAAKLSEDNKGLLDEKLALEKELGTMKEELSKSVEEARAARSDAATKPLVAMTTAEGTPIKSLLHVSPMAAAASLMKEGKSLTEIYTEHEKLTQELQDERRERRRLEQFLDDVLVELEQKAPEIRHQQEEYQRMLAAHNSVLAKLQESDEHARRLATNNADLERQSRRDRAEVKNMEAQATDLAHQVAILLKEVTDLKGETASRPVPGVPGATPGTAGAVISERLVAFKDIQELQSQNQQLRASLRRLADEEESKRAEVKEEYDRLLAEKSSQLMEELENVKQARERQEAAVESIVRQRDLYLSLLKEAGGAAAAGAASASALLVHAKTAGAVHGPDVSLLLRDKEEELTRLRSESEETLKISKAESEKYRNEAIQSRNALAAAQAEISFLRTRSDSLDLGIKERSSQLEDFTRRNAELIGQISEYQRQLREASVNQSRAQEGRRQVEAHLATKELELTLSQKSEARLKEELREAYDAKTKTQGLLEGEYARAELRESQWKTESERLEAEVVRLRSEWANSQHQLEQEKRQNAQLSSAADAQDKVTTGSMTDMRQKLDQATQERLDAESRATKAESRIAELEKSLERADAKVAMILQRASGSAQVAEGSTGTPLDPEQKKEADLLAALVRAENQAADAKGAEEAAKGHSQQWKAIAAASEEALKQVREAHEQFKMDVSKSSEDAAKKVQELEAKLADAEKNTVSQEDLEKKASEMAQSARTELTAQLETAKKVADAAVAAREEADTRLAVMRKDMDAAHEHNKQIQSNYEREVVLHGDDLKKLKEAESARTAALSSLAAMETKHKSAEAQLDELQNVSAEEKKKLSEALEAAQTKAVALDEQNKLLHKRLENLPGNVPESIRVDGEQGSLSDMQEVIKYLRREKETAEVKLRLLDQECARMKLNADLARKSADEALAKLAAETERNRSNTKSEEMHRELMSNLEQLNILKESNATLRSENEQNMKRAKEWHSKAEQLKNEMEPLKLSVTQKDFEIESASASMNAAKSETETWRARALQLQDKYKSIDIAKYKAAQTELAKAKTELEDAKEAAKAAQSKLEEDKAKWMATEAELKASSTKYQSMCKRIHADLLATRKKLAAQAEKAASQEGQPDTNAAVTAAKKAGEAELEKEKKRTEQLAKEAGERYKNMRLKAETAMKNMQRAAEEFQKERKEKEELQKELAELKDKLQQHDELKQLANEAEERRKLLAAKAAARKAESEKLKEAVPPSKRVKPAQEDSGSQPPVPKTTPLETTAAPVLLTAASEALPSTEAAPSPAGQAVHVHDPNLHTTTEQTRPEGEMAPEGGSEMVQSEGPAAAPSKPELGGSDQADHPPAADEKPLQAESEAEAAVSQQEAEAPADLEALREAALTSKAKKEEDDTDVPAPTEEDEEPAASTAEEDKTPVDKAVAAAPPTQGLSANAAVFTPAPSTKPKPSTTTPGAQTIPTPVQAESKMPTDVGASSATETLAPAAGQSATTKHDIAQQMKAKTAELERLRAIIKAREPKTSGAAAKKASNSTAAQATEVGRKRARQDESAKATDGTAAKSTPHELGAPEEIEGAREDAEGEAATKKAKVQGSEPEGTDAKLALEMAEDMKVDLKPVEDIIGEVPPNLDSLVPGKPGPSLEDPSLDVTGMEEARGKELAAAAQSTAQKSRLISLRPTGTSPTTPQVAVKDPPTPVSGAKTGTKKALVRQGSKVGAGPSSSTGKPQTKVTKTGTARVPKALAAAAEAAVAAASTTGSPATGRGRAKPSRGKATRGKGRGRGRGQGEMSC